MAITIFCPFSMLNNFKKYELCDTAHLDLSRIYKNIDEERRVTFVIFLP